MGVSISPLRWSDRDSAAELYWSAFRGKLRHILAPERKALAFLVQAVQPEWGLGAYDASRALMGVAGFKTCDGAFVQASISDFRNVYGTLGAAWRAPILDMFERDAVPNQLVMDGICVAEHARGNGIGRLLLDGIVEQARQRELTSVRLDVIDSNPRARALYARYGFVETSTKTLPFLAPVVGFQAFTTMQLDLRHPG